MPQPAAAPTSRRRDPAHLSWAPKTRARALLRGLGRWLIPALIASSARIAAAEPSQTDDQAAPTKEQKHAAYTRLKIAGNTALLGGRFEEALPLYRAAWDNFPRDGSLACDIGRLHTRRREPVPAALWLTRCVQLLDDASTNEATQRRRMEALDLSVALAHVTTVHVEVEPGVTLSMDGSDIGAAPQSEPAFVVPGIHHLEARKGARYVDAYFEGKPGETRRIPLTLPPLEPPAAPAPAARDTKAAPPPPPPAPKAPPTVPKPPSPPSLPWGTVIVGGTVTGAAIIGGVVLRVLASESSQQATETLDRLGSEGLNCLGPAPIDPRCINYDRLYNQGRYFTDASSVAFITASVVALGTLGVFVVESRRVSISPTVGGVIGRFSW